MTDSTLKDSTYNSKNGRYVLGGVTETSLNRIEWWDKNQIASDPTDIVYYLEKKYEGNPSILGHIFYGDTGLWWIICMYNTILDPVSELVEGKMLLIPTIERVKSEILSSGIAPGGVTSTRI